MVSSSITRTSNSVLRPSPARIWNKEEEVTLIDIGCGRGGLLLDGADCEAYEEGPDHHDHKVSDQSASPLSVPGIRELERSRDTDTECPYR